MAVAMMPLARCLVESLYGVSPGLLGQFTSVMYPWRTGGKRLTQFARTMRPEMHRPRGITRPRDVGKSGAAILTLLLKIMLCVPILQIRKLSASI